MYIVTAMALGRGAKGTQAGPGWETRGRAIIPCLAASLTVSRSRRLDFAKTQCGEEDVAILTGKLAGIPAKEIARTLEISESAVDHRYRPVGQTIQQELTSSAEGRRREDFLRHTAPRARTLHRIFLGVGESNGFACERQ